MVLHGPFTFENEQTRNVDENANGESFWNGFLLHHSTTLLGLATILEVVPRTLKLWKKPSSDPIQYSDVVIIVES